MATFDTWGGSWLTSWLTSWTREIPVVTPTNIVQISGLLKANKTNGILKAPSIIGQVK